MRPGLCRAPDAVRHSYAASLIRGRSTLRILDGPGSAKQRFTLHRARDIILRDARKMRAPQDEGRYALAVILNTSLTIVMLSLAKA
jgi:hypothetical protein